MAPGEHPIFPLGTGFHYLNEGAANIVYRISVPLPTPPPSAIDSYEDGEPVPSDEDTTPLWYRGFDNKLLRVRKDLPTTVPCAQAQLDWLKYIAPCFPEDQIVDQTLVELRPIGVIAQLNEELRGWEREYPMKGSLRSFPGDIRPTKRNGIFLADDAYGLLITDMTPRGFDETVIEFKPKWLAQSPSAPENSKRCRQCARVARENAHRARVGEPPQKTVCPLDLVSDKYEDVIKVAKLMLAPNRPSGPCSSDSQVTRFAKWLHGNVLLERLKEMQLLFDQAGPLREDVDDKDFLRSMTLRDCTVFLRLPNDETHEIEARIGDLDLKSPQKKEYWRETERTLIEEGWYQGLEDEPDWQPLGCKINTERDTASEGRRRNTQ